MYYLLITLMVFIKSAVTFTPDVTHPLNGRAAKLCAILTHGISNGISLLYMRR